MSERNKIAEVSRSISLPGCKLTPTALVMTKVTKDILISTGMYLQTIDACRSWWWGDFLNAYCQWKLAEDKAKLRAKSTDDAELKEKRYVHYAVEYSEASGVEEATMRDWRQVASFYEVGCRQPALSWSHHWEAMVGADGDLSVAMAWLNRAREQEWSKTDLRAAIRREAQLPLNNEPPAPFPYAEVVAFKRWASAAFKRLPAMDTSEYKTLRADLQPAVELAQAIDARLGLETFVNVKVVKDVKKAGAGRVKTLRVPPRTSQRR